MVSDPDQKIDPSMRDLAPDNTNLFPRSFEEYPEIVRGNGAYIYDSNGNEYFDAIGGNQCSNIGHGIEEIAQAASNQIGELEYTSSILFVNDQSQRFASKLSEFLPDKFNHIWMVSGGSEANESAIKMAREYHRENNNPEKHIVIGRRLSFHGNTLGTLAAGGKSSRREPYAPMYMDWPKAPAGYPYRCQHCESTEECREHGVECAKELETVIRDIGSKYVSAFIAEPLVGAANAAVAPGDEYFQVVREICDKYNVLLIMDEIMTGMGRTGEDFAIEHWGIIPDIITCAKGLSAGYTPLGGAMPREKIVNTFANKEDGFTHGHTFCFNPTSSAIASAVLDYMRKNNVVTNAKEVGEYTRERFNEFYEYDFVGEVRGRGLMLGVEFVQNKEKKTPLEDGDPDFGSHLLSTALANGVTVYPGEGSVGGHRGDHVLITPPLTISRNEADEMVERLHSTFQELEIDRYVST